MLKPTQEGAASQASASAVALPASADCGGKRVSFTNATSLLG